MWSLTNLESTYTEWTQKAQSIACTSNAPMWLTKPCLLRSPSLSSWVDVTPGLIVARFFETTIVRHRLDNVAATVSNLLMNTAAIGEREGSYLSLHCYSRYQYYLVKAFLDTCDNKSYVARAKAV